MTKIRLLVISLIAISITGCAMLTGVSGQKTVTAEIYVPKISYETFRFFSAGEKGSERIYRVYNDTFRKNSADWIWYELVVRNHSEKDGSFPYVEEWADEQKFIISSVRKEMSIAAGEKYLEYSAGIKNDWRPGYYTVRIFQDTLEIAVREFKIEL